ncbi:Reverse transcriptase domain [Trinorchestia longiramus]|nr:Reverse transcriptase domain [Trinorchestia longiramus]
MIDFFLEVQDPNTRTEHKQVLDYKRAHFELMKEELGSYNYEVLMNNKNTEECYMILKDKIATATDHHIPRKRIRPTNNPPWFSQEIKRLINARQHSYRRLKRYQTEPHRQEHIHACRAVKRTIKFTKRNKEITVAAQAKTNPKSFYKYVNDRRLKRDTIGPLIDSEGSTQTNNISKAKILNTYFTSVFTYEDLTEIPQIHVLNTQEILSDGVFTVEEVEEQLNILNPYKSTVPDGLSPRILKGTAERKTYNSCLTNFYDFFGEVNRLYDRTKAVDLVCLDFQKAFDQVPHERLIAKVEAHGIRGNYSRWIRNWLTGRTQRVVIHDETSDSALVTSGVPQGSVLGPLLFIIYINDLDVGIISKINKFADDTKLCHKAFTERGRATIQSDLNCLLQWTETWQMSFNIEKCSVMHVGANNRHFQHTMLSQSYGAASECLLQDSSQHHRHHNYYLQHDNHNPHHHDDLNHHHDEHQGHRHDHNQPQDHHDDDDYYHYHHDDHHHNQCCQYYHHHHHQHHHRHNCLWSWPFQRDFYNICKRIGMQ